MVLFVATFRGSVKLIEKAADAGSIQIETVSLARFDLVFCDVMLPGLSGMDFYEQLGSIAPELVMLDLPVTSHQLWMVRHRDIGKSARIRRFEEWLRQTFDPRTQPWYRAEFIHPSEFDRFPQARQVVSAP